MTMTAGWGVNLGGAELLPPTALDKFPDEYIHASTNEQLAPDLVLEIWRVHAEGYLNMGLVNENSIIKEGPLKGTLMPDIDKARGPNVEYFIGINGKDEKDCATMRKIHIPPGESFRGLPAFTATHQNISEAGLEILEGLEAAGVNIVEIAALARSGLSPKSVYEIIRSTMRGAMGQNEIWFFSMVTKTHDSFVRRWGENSFTRLGGDTKFADDRIGEGVYLRPLILNPNTFCDDILSGYQETGSPKLAKSLIYFTDGLTANQMSKAVYEARQTILSSSSFQ